ncbi:MAG TPA: hypothetical protein VHN79_07300 [Lacunisphaera sp.]|nr:hypothetical protein [Lacunisphaera sp.]
MKTPRLFAALAVAATASAVDLKDPAHVAREWSENFPQSSVAGDLSLKGQTTTPPRPSPAPDFARDLESLHRTESSPPSRRSQAPESIYDAPNYQVPQTLPNERPRGAVPWEYNGEVYWLVPLSAPAPRK